ncbi:hypothetical protein PuT2_15125 [Pusillimonas sp. T2]|uniref:helix-turn-helix domain-containing protein n=1 Tax=Pusillimonas sp. T2 TaxID=1548123 RepID=UPI000B9D1E72|nr:helix-turn-helix domain-containing protein [Pusillimonas sp. T2]OXR47960.1 hypothetical protein PuT2_15125 [Pusillimonas sp. T2]
MVSKKPTITRAPTFGLYGEPPESHPFFIHIESIKSRSNTYNWEIQTHIHQNLNQIIWLASGTINAQLDGIDFLINSPSAIIVPALHSHSFQTNNEATGSVLTVSHDIFIFPESKTTSSIFENLFMAPAVTKIAHESNDLFGLNNCFQILSAELSRLKDAESFITSRLAQVICLIIARHPKTNISTPHTGKNSDKKITDFLLLVEKHFKTEMKIFEYAVSLEISKDKLIRTTKLNLNKSPIQVILDRRIKEACQLLANTNSSVDRISQISGFSDVPYFCRQFKKKTGLTPLEFRKKTRQPI